MIIVHKIGVYTISCMTRSHRETHLMRGLNSPIIQISIVWTSCFKVMSLTRVTQVFIVCELGVYGMCL